MDERMARILRAGAFAAWNSNAITEQEHFDALDWIAENED